MHKPMDPEVKAIRALHRAMVAAPKEAQPRILLWFVGFWMEHFRHAMRDGRLRHATLTREIAALKAERDILAADLEQMT